MNEGYQCDICKRVFTDKHKYKEYYAHLMNKHWEEE